MVTAQAAVDNARLSEQMNERNAYHGGSKDWTNPSKCLVDKALERWSTRKMRADNTSVVIIMLDPPGPPKRDVLKSSPTQQYSLDYLANVDDDSSVPSEHLEIEPIENFTMYDHSTNEHIDMQSVRLAPLNRYENTSDGEVDQHQTFMNVIENSNTDVPYMNSFAESYNSLLNSSMETNQPYNYDNDPCEDEDVDDDDDDDFEDEDTMNHTHQYVGTPKLDPTYSLTKLQTRSEQQYGIYSTSMHSSPSTSHSMYPSYDHNLVDHNYLGETSTSHDVHEYEKSMNASVYDKNDVDEKLNSGETMPNDLSTEDSTELETNENLLHLSSSEYLTNELAEIDPNDISIIEGGTNDESESANSEGDENGNEMKIDEPMSCVDETNQLDSSIQINEISSSNNHSSHMNQPLMKKIKNAEGKSARIERKVTRSIASTSTVRVTRSAGVEKKTTRVTSISVRSIKPKLDEIIQKRTNAKEKSGGRIHKENISVVRKIQLDALMNSAIVSTARTRNSAHVSQKDNTTPLGQRTLRSQNAFTKVNNNTSSNKPTNSRSTTSTTHHTEHNSDVTSNQSVCTTRSASSSMTNSKLSGSNHNNSKIIVCKKLPKRLISGTVQIIKSNSSSSSSTSNNNNNNCKQPKKSNLNTPLHLTRQSIVQFASAISKKSQISSASTSSPTLRCKVLVTKNPSLVLRKCDPFLQAVSRTSTRRTRLHQ